MNPDLKVYWRPGCSSCVKVKEYLAREGVPFESIDVSARPEAMRELLAFGVKTVPVVVRGGEFVFAQALEDVSRFIGRRFDQARLSPEALMRKWLHVLRAVQKHARQLPAVNALAAKTFASTMSPASACRSRSSPAGSPRRWSETAADSLTR